MIRPLLLTVLCGILGVQGGKLCKKYYSTISYTTYYCSGYCCGSIYDDECCGGDDDDDDDDDLGGLGVAYIIMIVVISIISLSIIISLIICAVKSCTKSGTNGRVIRPREQPGVFFMQTGFAPQPYTGPSVAPPPYHPPPFAVGSATQAGKTTDQQHFAAPAYPPELPTSPPPEYSPRHT